VAASQRLLRQGSSAAGLAAPSRRSDRAPLLCHEIHDRADIDRLAAALKEVLS